MVIELSKATAASFKVYNGVTSAGAAKYQTKTVSGLNPEMSDEDFMKAAGAISQLMGKPVNSISRVNTTEMDDGEAGRA